MSTDDVKYRIEEGWVFFAAVVLSFIMTRYGIGGVSAWREMLPTLDFNVYYLIGNGWMMGKLPYVELADIKGPLVYLLYGVGSLVTPGRFLGVSVLHAFVLGCGLLYAYKTSKLFLSASVSILVVLMYAVYTIGGETSPAAYVLVMEHVSMYYILLRGGRDLFRRREMFCMGCFVAVALLMKFNLVAFWIPVSILVLWKNRVWGVLWLACGFVSVFLPVVVYLWFNGALYGMWVEYVETALAYGGATQEGNALSKAGFYWFYQVAPVCMRKYVLGTILTIGGVFVLSAWGLLWIDKKNQVRKSVGVVLLCSLVLIVLANYMGPHSFSHYAMPLYVYSLMSIVAMVRVVQKMFSLKVLNVLCVPFILAVYSFFLVYEPIRDVLYPNEMDSVNKEVTELVLKRITPVSDDNLLFLEPDFLHCWRLTGKLPSIRHFVQPYTPGGYELYRGEQVEYMETRKPLCVFGIAKNVKVYERMFDKAGVKYNCLSHDELGLPPMPASLKDKEIVIYELSR